jgi:hypothetical protein
MIGLLLVAGVTTGQRVWERDDARQARGEELDSAQTTLRARIEQIYPATMFNANPPYIDFEGTTDELVFLASPSQSARPAPLRRYHLFLDPAGDLVLSSVSDVAISSGAIENRQILLKGVRQLELSYFGPVFPDEQRRWRGIWHEQSALPELVRVRVGFASGDPRWWADLLVRPRPTIDAQCQLNPVTHHCKGRI